MNESMKSKQEQLEKLRRRIIDRVFIKQWKEVWFFPEYKEVKGWLGTEDVIFVGSNPSSNYFPTKYDDFFYNQLKNNGFKNAHLTDLIKTKAANKNFEQVFQDNIIEQIKFFQEEIEIIKPKLIAIMGHKCKDKLRELGMWDDENMILMTHYSAIRFPKNKKKFIQDIKCIREKIYG